MCDINKTNECFFVCFFWQCKNKGERHGKQSQELKEAMEANEDNEVLTNLLESLETENNAWQNDIGSFVSQQS